MTQEVRMTTPTTAPPVNFNLAVETLKRTLKQDKSAAASLSQAQKPEEEVEPNIVSSVPEVETKLGQHLSTDV